MGGWRPNLAEDRTPIQQSLTIDNADYAHYAMSSLMQGVVLDVHPADSEHNRSAHLSSTRRGVFAEATVLLVGTNRASNMIIDHVIITQPVPSGLDSYHEHLPRPSSNRVDGALFNNTLANIDPYDLDGDWCVVGFLGDSLDSPFIVTWWPHPRNAYDPATSGNGNTDSEGAPQALEQSGRYFQRINGVEYVVTAKGDLYLSTTYANHNLQFAAEQSPTRGRWGRSELAGGGSILVEVKPSQTLELSWDAQLEGVGVRRGSEVELPQTNPPVTAGNPPARENLYVRMEENAFKVTAPSDITLRSRARITVISEDVATIRSTNLLELESRDIQAHASNSIRLTVAGDVEDTPAAGSADNAALFLYSEFDVRIEAETEFEVVAETVAVVAADPAGVPITDVALHLFSQSNTTIDSVEDTELLAGNLLFLGSPGASQPFVRGEDLINQLQDLIEALSDWAIKVSAGILSGGGTFPAADLVDYQDALAEVQSSLPDTLSDKIVGE